MLGKILNITYLIIIIIFTYITISIYFSESNVKKINDKRINIEKSYENLSLNLPVIKNDTDNIIKYNTDTFIKKKIKKRNFWELLNINE